MLEVMGEEEVPSNKDYWDMVFFQAVFFVDVGFETNS